MQRQKKANDVNLQISSDMVLVDDGDNSLWWVRLADYRLHNFVISLSGSLAENNFRHANNFDATAQSYSIILIV